MEATLRAFLNIFPEKMKKRTIWYLFDRYLGHFLREKLTLDQLSIDLIGGKGCSNELHLDVDSLNEELSFLPVKFVDGCFIDEISVYIPWSSLLTESCSLQIKGARFICQLAEQPETKSIITSDYLSRSIMSSSLQLAEEIVHENQEEKFEGLEIFAHLIDSVLRRVELVVLNTSFILRSKRKQLRNPASEEDEYCYLEIKVRTLKCEENGTEEDKDAEKDDVKNAPKIITKKLTIEDIEIFLDGDKICTLADRHVMEVNVRDSRCDIQVYLASILTAVLEKKHISELINMASNRESSSNDIFKKGDKVMSPIDYARIEHQLKFDSTKGKPAPSRHNLNATLLNTEEASNAWTSSGDANKSCDNSFLPIDYSNHSRNGPKNTTEKKEPQKSEVKSFNCAIKLPGLALCLVDSSYSGNATQIDAKAKSLVEVNAALDELITCDHLRFTTVPIQIEIGSSGCKIVSGDIWVAEKNQRGLCPYIWTESKIEIENDQPQPQLPRPKSPKVEKISFQCLIDSEKLELRSRNVTNCIVDPTLLERIDKYFPQVSDGSGTSSDFIISVMCPEIRGKLLIPIADLRKEEKSVPSELRPFWLEFEGSDFKFTTNMSCYDMAMHQFILGLADPHGSKEIGRMTTEGSTPIRLSIKRGADTSSIIESEMIQTVLETATMTESIFICTTANTKLNAPFQTRTPIVQHKQEEDAKTLLPNNLTNSQSYFETCKSFTQLQVDLSADNVDIFVETKEQIDLLYNALGNDLVLWTPNRDPNRCRKERPVGFEGSSANQSFHNLVTCLLRCDNLNVAIGDHAIISQNVFIGLSFGLQDDTSNIVSIHGSGVSWSFNSDTVISSNHFCNKSSSLDLTFEINTKDLPVSKKIKVAIQLSEAILFKTSPDIFIDFWNYVNVTNEPVLGYTPPKILTELHVSVTNGAISYGSDNFPPPPRPVLVTFDGICVTAMVVEDTSDTLMRFIIEEAAFYFKKNSLSSKCLRNYVCVIDSGLIDMHLKLSENDKIEFRAVNNIINVRACNDSLAALCRLIINLINQNSDSRSDDDLPSYAKAVGSSIRKGSNAELLKEVLSELGNDPMALNQQKPPEYKEAEERKKDGESTKKKEGGKKKDGGRKKREEEKKKDDARKKDGDKKKEKKVKEEDKTEKLERYQDRITATVDYDGPSTSSATGLKKGEMTDSGFWLLGDDDIGAGIKATDEPIVRVLTKETIIMLDNTLSVGTKKTASEEKKFIVARYCLEEMSLLISIYGGRDFEDNHGGEDDSDAEEDEKKVGLDSDYRIKRETKVHFANDESNALHLWESINLEEGSDIGQPTCSRPTIGNHSSKSMGGRLRKSNICVQLHLYKIKSTFDKFNDSCPTSWKFSFDVKNIEIRDRLNVSNINKMLYEYISENIPRRSNSSMISIRAKTFRNPVDSHEECDLRISLKPLRVNIDQDTIMFLVEYFTTLKILLDLYEKSTSFSSSGSNSPSPVAPSPERDFNLCLNVYNTVDEAESPISPVSPDDANSSKPSSLFVKSFEFTPAVPIRLDYHGKRIDFEQGTIPGLLMGLAHLNQSELYLKRLHQKRGILGVDRVIQYALMEWFDDIKKKQIPSIIGSIGPMNSVRQLVQGVIDLFWIPVDQYRRDRRIVRGIQRGASSFSSSTATAVLDLANRLVHVIQGTAQFAHDVVLSPNRSPQHNIRGSVPKSQPRDLREGVASAYTVMKEGLNETYRNVATAGAQADGVTETVGALIGTLPSNILQPIIKATEATSNVIVGMRNQLTPEARKDDQYKWKRR